MTQKKVAIIDYGVGNIRSLMRAIESTPLDSCTINIDYTRDKNIIMHADLIVLPGVGSYDAATRELDSIRDDLVDTMRKGTPTIGMCLGMQLMFTSSEEGTQASKGLGLFDGPVTQLTSQQIPHMGWNKVETREDLGLSWAYFAHSYACRPADTSIVVGWTSYQGDRFPSIIRSGTILGTQFHPEKSDIDGVRLIQNFIVEVLS